MIFWGAEEGLMGGVRTSTKLLDFGGVPDWNRDPKFLDLDSIWIQKFFCPTQLISHSLEVIPSSLFLGDEQ